MRIEILKSPYNEKWSKRNILEKIRRYSKKHVIFVLETEKLVVGFIIGRISLEDTGKSAFISELFVAKKFQGKGYGKLLTDSFEKYAKENKANSISLISNQKSKAFKIYNKLGFKKAKDIAYMNKKLK